MNITNTRNIQAEAGIFSSFFQSHRAWRWRIFAATWLCYAGLYFCRKPFYITKSALSSHLNISASTLGAIGAAYLVSYTIGQFISAFTGQRLGQRLLLLVGMGVSVICNIVFGFANSPATFAIFMTLNGLVQATGWSGTVGVMANWFTRSERGAVMGWWSTNFQMGGVLANALAAWALGAFGFRYSYFFGSLVLLVVWIFFYFNQRNKPEDLGLAPIVDEAPHEIEKLGQGKLGQEKLGWTRAAVTNILLLGVFYFFIKFKFIYEYSCYNIILVRIPDVPNICRNYSF